MLDRTTDPLHLKVLFFLLAAYVVCACLALLWECALGRRHGDFARGVWWGLFGANGGGGAGGDDGYKPVGRTGLMLSADMRLVRNGERLPKYEDENPSQRNIPSLDSFRRRFCRYESDGWSSMEGQELELGLEHHLDHHLGQSEGSNQHVPTRASPDMGPRGAVLTTPASLPTPAGLPPPTTGQPRVGHSAALPRAVHMSTDEEQDRSERRALEAARRVDEASYASPQTNGPGSQSVLASYRSCLSSYRSCPSSYRGSPARTSPPHVSTQPAHGARGGSHGEGMDDLGDYDGYGPSSLMSKVPSLLLSLVPRLQQQPTEENLRGPVSSSRRRSSRGNNSHRTPGLDSFRRRFRLYEPPPDPLAPPEYQVAGSAAYLVTRGRPRGSLQPHVCL